MNIEVSNFTIGADVPEPCRARLTSVAIDAEH
jgi:hypothetical protein